ncbi:MAG: glycosyltransferase family 4 protein [Phycisphaerales bacterium]|jgi:glycosyltransferase involved in cell wall biosynthesis|nr:glycosyltransferase family 4 protein [Phycisphaerales bacterium]
MKSILILATNLQQASYRLRIAALIEPLRQRGIELVVQIRPRNIIARRRLLQSAGRFDAVIIQRKFLSPSEARLLRKTAHKIILDIDDALMFHNRPVGMISRLRTRRGFAATAQILDHLVAGNQYLADQFRQLRPDLPCSILPTVVDVATYPQKIHKPSTSPRLVWIGSSSTLPYLAEALPALEEAAKIVPGLKLTIIADRALTSDHLPIELIPWSQSTEQHDLLRGDIGIAPTPRDPWTLGKCGFKIIQYMAAGLPVIASPIGANAEIITEGQTGHLPPAYADWPGLIAKLAKDVELRQKMGEAGRSRAMAHFSLPTAIRAWEAIL